MTRAPETPVQIGQRNPNGQILLQRTNRQSDNHAFAKVWILRCQRGHTYETNSCDFHLRKCPHCLDGSES
jgi:hypothetical protein